MRAWELGDKIALPTPGHSSCSISLLWPDRKAIFISDADWPGNPVFPSSSVRDSIAGFETMKQITEAGLVEFALPAHGRVMEGKDRIVDHFSSCAARLIEIRHEVLSFCRSRDVSRDVDIIALTDDLVRTSPFMKSLKAAHYPRVVLFVHNMVVVCLREEGIIQ